MSIGLLGKDEPPALVTLKDKGKSPFFLTCDHAGNLLPRRLGTLGLSPRELESHVAWDIGAAAVTRLMADSLDASAMLQTYSRLVIDCNRPPDVDSSIAELSEYTAIPGNRALGQMERDIRLNEIFRPYHDRIRSELNLRQKKGVPTALVALHSFTPVFKGVRRPWQIGILYNRDSRLAKPLIELLQREGDVDVGDNQPYSVNDETDYTVPVHGERRGLPHVEIEIRQDLIAHKEGQRIWAERLSGALISCWQVISA